MRAGPRRQKYLAARVILAILASGALACAPEAESIDVEPAVGLERPAIPTTGAYVGAWVRPEIYSDAGKKLAVQAREDDLSFSFDIVGDYVTWGKPLLSTAEEWVAARGSYPMISWATPDLRLVASGAEDDVLRRGAQEVADAGYPLFLRFRWEMDRPNLNHVVRSPEVFIKAWDRARRIFSEYGADNVAWVWCPLGQGFDAGRAAAYYPGDDQVDWLCVDVYPSDEWYSMSRLLTAFQQFADQHQRPRMIGEFGVPRDRSPAARTTWLEEAFVTIEADPSIKAVVYFDSSPDDRPPHREYSLTGDHLTIATFARLARKTSPQFAQRSGSQ